MAPCRIFPLRKSFLRAVLHGRREPEVERGYPKYRKGKVYVNPASWFDGVFQELWEFQVGGHQVLNKWLKDRGPKKGNPGRVLTDEDIRHYLSVVIALNETIRLMQEIDEVIDAHGGWPDVFVGESEDSKSPKPFE